MRESILNPLFMSQKLKNIYLFIKRQQRKDPFQFATILLLVLLLSFFAFKVVFSHWTSALEAAPILALPESKIAQLNEDLKSQKVAKITSHTLNNGSLFSPSTKKVYEIIYKDGVRLQFSSELMRNETISKAFYEHILKSDLVVDEGIDHGAKNSRLDDFIFFILYISAIVILIFVFQRAAQDLLVGKSFTPKQQNFDISFSSIVGYEEVKNEFMDVVQRLENAKKFKKLGLENCKGILLTGSPGVGKTLFAKALANESKSNFFYATGADFAELYVGVGARRIRALFSEARLRSPSIIFIDEIDAIGSRSGYGMDSERLATINQMLAEMDGMNENHQILVIGATNHPEKLDPALLRPGRFDKKINIPNPDAKTRKDLMRYYLENKEQLEEGLLESFAQRTVGFTGAQVKNLIQEAKTMALREMDMNAHEELPRINARHLEKAFNLVLLGHGKTNGSAKELERIAIHELGHARIAYLQCPDLMVDKVTIEGQGAALGFTVQYPIVEQQLYTKKDLECQIQILLAGRAAEEIYFNQTSSGAADDLRRATDIATKMVSSLGYGKLTGLRFVSPAELNALPKDVSEDIKDILQTQLETVLRILHNEKPWLESKKRLLMERKTLSKEELFSETQSDNA